MKRKLSYSLLALTLSAISLTGCESPSYADKGAVLGGLGGAGVGALVGHAVGNTGAGAVIGAGVGALSGAAVGSGLDDVEAKNRAQIAQTVGQQAATGSVTIDDVIQMTRSGVNEDLIVSHIRANGIAAPLRPADLIVLQQNGVTNRVIEVMQATPPRTVVIHDGPPVIYDDRYYDPYWGPRYYYGGYYGGYYHHRPPGVGVGVVIR